MSDREALEAGSPGNVGHEVSFPAGKGCPLKGGMGRRNPTDERLPVSSYYNTTSVLLCLVITALVCLSVTIFSFQTKVSPGACRQGRARGPEGLCGAEERQRPELGLGTLHWGYIGLWG